MASRRRGRRGSLADCLTSYLAVLISNSSNNDQRTDRCLNLLELRDRVNHRGVAGNGTSVMARLGFKGILVLLGEVGRRGWVDMMEHLETRTKVLTR